MPKLVWSIPLAHLCIVWMITLYALHFFLGTLIAAPLAYVVHLGYPPLLLMMAIQGPVILARAKTWVWDPPLLLLTLVSGGLILFSVNPGLAKITFQYFVIYYTLSLGTATYVRTPRQAVVIVLLLVGQFLWYALWSPPSFGLVAWHPTLKNNDAFGGLMVQGVGMCYYFAAAARKRNLRLLLYALAGFCVLGVVASYARGAFLSLVCVAGWIWIRSPNKLKTALAGLAGVVVVVIAASLIFEPGFFYNEIMSSFEEGASEGTGGARMDLWKVAVRVWMLHPIFGVGGGNFGAFAADHFRVGELEAFPNPNVLYGFNLHNSYFQVLSEFGLVGMFLLGWQVIDFMRRNKALREPGPSAVWAAKSGGTFDLKYLALGLESANVANMFSGIFYASLFSPWFYTVWIVNRVLWGVTQSPAGARPSSTGPPRRRR